MNGPVWFQCYVCYDENMHWDHIIKRYGFVSLAYNCAFMWEALPFLCPGPSYYVCISIRYSNFLSPTFTLNWKMYGRELSSSEKQLRYFYARTFFPLTFSVHFKNRWTSFQSSSILQVNMLRFLPDILNSSCIFKCSLVSFCWFGFLCSFSRHIFQCIWLWLTFLIKKEEGKTY